MLQKHLGAGDERRISQLHRRQKRGRLPLLDHPSVCRRLWTLGDLNLSIVNARKRLPKIARVEPLAASTLIPRGRPADRSQGSRHSKGWAIDLPKNKTRRFQAGWFSSVECDRLLRI
jgi:hypothetical protein